VLEEIRNEFYFLNSDIDGKKRLFFDNSGGSLRLKRCVEAKADLERLPDCPERTHERAQELKKIVDDGRRDILETVFGAKKGSVMTELTASQTMFQLVGIIMENVSGTNAVVSSIEHPSAFDAVEYYCKKTGRELRVIPANKITGGIDADEVAKLIDKDTCLLSVMSASNVTGKIMDISEIVRRAREIKPDLFIISDAVQHAPHCIIDAEATGVNGMNFAPYKFFGVRGCGFAYVSERVAALPHHKLILKDQSVFDLGTSAPGNFAAMSAVIDYVCEIGERYINKGSRRELFAEGMRRIHLQERALLYRLLEGGDGVKGLRHIKGVKVLCDTDDLSGRDLIAAISIDGIGISQTVEEYKKRGVIVCDRVNTSMYASRILAALDLDGAIRVSPMHCHGYEDIDEFLRITEEIAREFGSRQIKI
jgi:selenocysteine lyase/cysteine desulfurase